MLRGFIREGEGVAAHFRLTASRVADPAAEALVESSVICCEGGLELVAELAGAQL